MNLVVAGGIGAAAVIGGLWYKKRNTSDEEAADIDVEFKDNSGKKGKKAKAKHEKEESARIEREALKKEKKLEKERARKAAKKEKKVQDKIKAEAEAVEAEKAEKAAPAEEPSTGGKKKKKKNKKKAAQAAQVAAAPVKTETVEEPVVEEPVEEAAWTEIKVSSKKKKQSDAEVVAEPTSVHELYVEQDKFGVVIGPGGSTLRAIQDATNTQIEMPKQGGMRRDIIVSGNNDEDCKTAIRAIKDLVNKGYSSLTHAGTTDDVITMNSGREIGMIVGPGGKYIKMIQEATSTKINTPDRESSSLDISVVGPSEGVRTAIHAMKQLIKDGFSTITHPNQSVAEVLVPRSMLGTLIGPGGVTIKKLQEETKCRVDISDSKSEIISVKILGEPSDIITCRHALTELITLPDPEPVPQEWTKEASAVNLTMVW